MRTTEQTSGPSSETGVEKLRRAITEAESDPRPNLSEAAVDAHFSARLGLVADRGEILR